MINRRRFRQLVLSVVYALGVLGIVASGGGGSDSDDPVGSCSIRVSTIAPAKDGSNDIWIGVYIGTGPLLEEEVNSVVRLNSEGSQDLQIQVSSGLDNGVQTVEVAADGSNDVYVGGNFSGGILRLNGDGSIDSGFNVGSGFNGTILNVSKITAAADGSGDVYVGGFFTEYDGTPVSGLVRLNSDGSLDAGFTATPATVSGVSSIAMATDNPFIGYVYTAGSNNVQRWQDDGLRDNTFGVTGTIVVPEAGGLGDIYVGSRGPSGHLNPDGLSLRFSSGTVNTFFSTGSGFVGGITSILRADDMTGNIYAGGNFTTYDGNPATGIIRLGPDGSRDFNFITGNGFEVRGDPVSRTGVQNLALAADMTGDVYVGGEFTFYNDIPSNGIVRLNNDGSRDMAFAVNIASSIGRCTDANYLGFDL